MSTDPGDDPDDQQQESEDGPLRMSCAHRLLPGACGAMARAGRPPGVWAPRRSGSRGGCADRTGRDVTRRPPARALSLPFAAIAGLGVALVPLPGAPLESNDWVIGGLLVLAVWLSIVLAPWDRIPPRVQLVPLVGSLVAVALLRDATGGAGGGLGVLVLLPVVWVALYGDRLEARASSGSAPALVWAYPLVIVGAPKYPATGWRGWPRCTGCSAG